MRLLALVFGGLALACMARSVPAIVTGSNTLQGLLLFLTGTLLAGAGGYCWELGSR